MEVQHLKIAGRHHSTPFARIDVDAVHGNRHGPEQTARCDTRVKIRQLRLARTGRVNVNSYQSESAAVNASIRSAIHALHEAHVRPEERIDGRLTRGLLPSHHHATDVRQADEAIEVGDGHWLRVHRIECAGSEDVKRSAQSGVPPGIGTGSAGAKAWATDGRRIPLPTRRPRRRRPLMCGQIAAVRRVRSRSTCIVPRRGCGSLAALV